MNPHNWLSRLGEPPLDRWQCQYCRVVGAFDELIRIECTYQYPLCEHCGQTPQCAPDCPGILRMLTSPGVRVVKDRGNRLLMLSTHRAPAHKARHAFYSGRSGDDLARLVQLDEEEERPSTILDEWATGALVVIIILIVLIVVALTLRFA